jgi:hypothetical protein
MRRKVIFYKKRKALGATGDDKSNIMVCIEIEMQLETEILLSLFLCNRLLLKSGLLTRLH